MPHALGSFGGQVGTSSVLVRAIALLLVDAEVVWVVAATPVRTRTTTNARTICFMRETPGLLVVGR